MEEVQKIKPYIDNLSQKLSLLKPDLEKMTLKPLDEQLLLLSDERSKLDLTNRYSYVLSSLMFAYMKVLSVKDVSPIMTELTRVKEYMNKAKALDQKHEREKELQKEEQISAKKAINSVLDGNHSGPSISKVNFQGKHTRFDKEPSSGKSESTEIKAQDITEKIKESKSKQKKLSEKKSRSKGKTNKVSKKRQ